MHCQDRVSKEQRQKLFSEFWKIENHSRKWDFIGRHVTVMKKKVETTNWESRRSYSHNYCLRFDNTEIKVCKKMFLDTFDISDTWIQTTSKKMGTTGYISADKRGKHENHHRMNENVRNSVIEHINMFPRVPSHYVRKESKREYLEERLSIRKMHMMYKTWMTNNEKTEIASERQYRQLFNTEFNISFHKTKKDRCDLCESWENANSDEKIILKEKYESHILNKQLIRQQKDLDKKEAQTDKLLCVSCFDLQKVLNVPRGETSAFYYKRALSVFNFTIFDIGNTKDYCYLWTEETAKKGANEIGSCLLEFIKHKSVEGIKEFRFYSDNCSGQNRNRFIFAMLLYAAVKFKIRISHSFLEVGHTQNEGDSMHALIENKSKGVTIYRPQDWYNLIQTAREGPKKYVVTEMSNEMILDFKILIEGHN